MASEQTVREIALEQPTAIRVFEQFGIDYCCGGRKPLAEACAAGNLKVDSVLAALEEAEKKRGIKLENWAEKSLTSLTLYLVYRSRASRIRETRTAAAGPTAHRCIGPNRLGYMVRRWQQHSRRPPRSGGQKGGAEAALGRSRGG